MDSEVLVVNWVEKIGEWSTWLMELKLAVRGVTVYDFVVKAAACESVNTRSANAAGTENNFPIIVVVALSSCSVVRVGLGQFLRRRLSSVHIVTVQNV